MFLSKNLLSANDGVSWSKYEMPPVDAVRPPQISDTNSFVSLQVIKEDKEEFTPLGGKREDARSSSNQSDLTFEDKMILLEKEAYDKGFAQGEKDGFEFGETKAKKVIENIENLLDDMTRLKGRLVKRYEKEILETVFAIAKKVIHTHMQIEESAVRNTILEVLNLTTEKRDITLKINPDDFEYVENLRPEIFSRHMNVKSIAITSDPTISRGGCFLETPSGDVDASIETQLDNLHQSLKDAYMS